MRTRVIVAVALGTLLIGACGGSPDPITPTTPAPATSAPAETPTIGTVPPGQEYASGTATASTTGTRTETLEATLDTGGFGDDEDLELEYVAENGWTIRFDFTPAGVGPAESDWFAIGMPGTAISDAEYYYDGFETQCETTLTQYDSAGVAGTYTCDELSATDGSKTIDVEGSFAATP